MLLAIDIGNSNISVGLFDEKRDLKFLSSIDTDSRKTADQISIDLMNIFSLYRYDLRDVSGAIFSSVVPPINFMMAKALTRLLGKPPMIVGPGVKTGLNIRMEIHNQLGADLVAGAVAALDKYPTPIIMIDMGTATTISYISSKRSYEGGLMFPGVRLSLDALSDHTAQLPDISLQHPKSLIGKTPRTACAPASSTAPPACWTVSLTASASFCPRERLLPSWPPAATPPSSSVTAAIRSCMTNIC